VSAVIKRLPLPPFANQIEHADELVMIYCGERAWRLAQPAADRVASLAYPKGRAAADFMWPVHSKRVLVLGMGEPRRDIDLLCIELLRTGASTVYARYDAAEPLITYNNPAARRQQTEP
jgi:hypothetical protein